MTIQVEDALAAIAKKARWYADNAMRDPQEVDHALCVEILDLAERALSDSGVPIPLSLIEEVHGPTDRKLRDHLAELGLYDQDADACTDPRVAWGLMYPSMQAAGLFAEIASSSAALTGEDPS